MIRNVTSLEVEMPSRKYMLLTAQDAPVDEVIFVLQSMLKYAQDIYAASQTKVESDEQ